jgi:hypothetical protein
MIEVFFGPGIEIPMSNNLHNQILQVCLVSPMNGQKCMPKLDFSVQRNSAIKCYFIAPFLGKNGAVMRI